MSFSQKKKCTFLGMICLLSPLTAQATGAHFLVDDAEVVDQGCLVETWLTRLGDINSLTARPACGVNEAWEIAIPLEYNLSNSGLSAAAVEAKTLLAGSRSFGEIALTLGANYDREQSGFDKAYVNVPWSADVGGNMIWHLNGGLSYLRGSHNWYTTWGMASTFAYSETTDLMIEAAGFGSESPSVAAGARRSFGQRSLVDVSVGRDFELESNFVNIGFAFPFTL